MPARVLRQGTGSPRQPGASAKACPKDGGRLGQWAGSGLQVAFDSWHKPADIIRQPGILSMERLAARTCHRAARSQPACGSEGQSLRTGVPVRDGCASPLLDARVPAPGISPALAGKSRSGRARSDGSLARMGPKWIGPARTPMSYTELATPASVRVPRGWGPTETNVVSCLRGKVRGSRLVPALSVDTPPNPAGMLLAGAHAPAGGIPAA